MIPLWSDLICFKILCIVLKGVNSIGLQLIWFDQLWSSLIYFNILCMVLKGVSSIGLQVMRFDLVWSGLIHFKIIMYGLERSHFNWSKSDLVWSTLKIYVWYWKESIELVYKWSGLFGFDVLWSALTFYVLSCKESI